MRIRVGIALWLRWLTVPYRRRRSKDLLRLDVGSRRTAVLAAWVGAIIAPNEAFSYGQQGSFPIPELSGVWPLQAANSVGDLGALPDRRAGPSIPNGPCQTQTADLLLMVGLVTMFVAQCRTSIAGFLFGTLLLFILTSRTVIAILLGGVSALVAAFAGLAAPVWAYLARSQQQQQLLSLSGRLDWWTTAWTKILERPLIGWAESPVKMRNRPPANPPHPMRGLSRILVHAVVHQSSLPLRLKAPVRCWLRAR